MIENQFYDDAVESFTAMANAKGTEPIDIYHFRMWCRVAAEELSNLRAKLADAEAKIATVAKKKVRS